MNELTMKSALRQMGIGERRMKKWFTDQGLTDVDLSEAVDADYLIHYDKAPKDFMSDAGYILTRTGREFAWGKNKEAQQI